MSASARFKDVPDLLGSCAPGYGLREGTHAWIVTYNGRTFRELPKYQNIELGWIRKMIRHLRIDPECAKKYIP